MALTLEQLFNEEWYLANNPRVAEAVASGRLSSGLFHFSRFGQFEGRDPNPIFDTGFYLNDNLAVRAAVEGNQLTAVQHFIENGQFEGRDPSPFFDTSFYLDRYPGVAEAVDGGLISAIAHFIENGQFEGRIPRQLFSDFYIFGDSLVDVGNAFSFSGGLVPPSPPYFDGRFSNGFLWVESLASLVDVDLDSDTNFAFGGARTDNSNNLSDRLPENTPPLPGLQDQIDRFVQQVPQADPDALYVIAAGANDYVDPNSFDVQETLGNLSGAITRLAAVGARNFLISNLPDLGEIPAGRDLGGELQLGLTLLSQAHNAGLAAALATIEQDPNLNTIVLDVNSALDRAIANPAEFGLTNVTDDFLTAGATNPDEFLFWDSIHPSARASEILADTAIKTITEIPELVSILETSPGF
jgi:phospholipase/lecithinase/hemolysin